MGIILDESPILEVKGVRKNYSPDVLALKRVNFTVRRGEFVFLTGLSGAGKTTLLRLLFRAETPQIGEIWVEGVEIVSMARSQLPYLRRKVGVVFQDFKLLLNRTVMENVALTLEVAGYNRRQIARRVRQMLSAVGLEGKENVLAAQLSGGEQQRVAIARAVINRPSILLADEPTGNLDRKRTNEVLEIMKELNAMGTTVILATHDESLFKNTHRRVLQLKDGVLEAD